jgi:hypothetical protein
MKMMEEFVFEYDIVIQFIQWDYEYDPVVMEKIANGKNIKRNQNRDPNFDLA